MYVIGGATIYIYIYIYIYMCSLVFQIRRPLLVRGPQAVRTLRGGEPFIILPYGGGGLHFAFLARAAPMLQTASGDDPEIK